jgi:LacI family transcriptional regulator
LVKRLKDLPKPAAVFAFHDAEAANVLDACLRADIRVPDQVAILGVDNNPMICESLRVPLSSVNHDLERLGYAGSALLDGLMNGIVVQGNPIIIPPRGVTERQSTDALAVTHEPVRLALEFMRRNHARMIGPEDAARVSGRPRSYLEADFRKLFQRSMRQELARIRLKSAKALLIETDLSVADVAARSGFNTAQYFNNVFRRETGITPLMYRLEHTALSRL